MQQQATFTAAGAPLAATAAPQRPGAAARTPSQRPHQGRAALLSVTSLAAAVLTAAAVLMPAPALAANPLLEGDDLQALRLQGAALNAMLVPLLDDTEPPRWNRSLAAMRCGAGSKVWIDGQPLKPGALVPARSFTMRWKMAGCQPLSRRESFTGDVTLTVFHEEAGGYSAMVVPTALKVRTLDSSAVWSTRFAVVMP